MWLRCAGPARWSWLARGPVRRPAAESAPSPRAVAPSAAHLSRSRSHDSGRRLAACLSSWIATLTLQALGHGRMLRMDVTTRCLAVVGTLAAFAGYDLLSPEPTPPDRDPRHPRPWSAAAPSVLGLVPACSSSVAPEHRPRPASPAEPPPASAVADPAARATASTAATFERDIDYLAGGRRELFDVTRREVANIKERLAQANEARSGR